MHACPLGDKKDPGQSWSLLDGNTFDQLNSLLVLSADPKQQEKGGGFQK